MVRDILRLDLAVISVSKHLNIVEKISKLCGREQCQRGFHCSRDFWCDFCVVK